MSSKVVNLLVVGGEEDVVERKVEQLLVEGSSNVVVIRPTVSAGLLKLKEKEKVKERIVFREKVFEIRDLSEMNYDKVLVSNQEQEVLEELAAYCTQRTIPVEVLGAKPTENNGKVWLIAAGSESTHFTLGALKIVRDADIVYTDQTLSDDLKELVFDYLDILGKPYVKDLETSQGATQAAGFISRGKSVAILIAGGIEDCVKRLSNFQEYNIKPVIIPGCTHSNNNEVLPNGNKPLLTDIKSRLNCTDLMIQDGTIHLQTHTKNGAPVKEDKPLVVTSPRLIYFSDDHLSHINEQLSKQPLEERLRWCFHSLPHLAQVSAFGASGMVIIDVMHKIGLSCVTVFLDTLHHFPETLEHVNLVKEKYSLDLRTYHCKFASTQEAFEKHFQTTNMWETEVERYDMLVKVEPLERALSELDVHAWISGRRRDQGGERSSLQLLEYDIDGRIKVNPIYDWTFKDVWRYLLKHKVPYNSLYDKGYKSVGDKYTTSPVNANDPERAGRFKQHAAKTECGIHNRQNHIQEVQS